MTRSQVFDVGRVTIGLCAVLLLTFLPGPSSGFSFTTPDGSGGLQFNQTTGNPVKWRFPLVTQLVGFGPFPPGFVPINGSVSWDANALQTLQEWNGVSGSRFQFTGIPQVGDACGLGDLVVTSGWAPNNCGVPFGDAVALTRILYQLNVFGWQIVDADVLVNNSLVWDVYDGPIQVDGGGNTILDFRRIVLHEYGHVLGLGHPDVAGQVVFAVMNSTFAPGSDADRLTVDDRNGAITLYRAAPLLGGGGGGGGGGSSAFDAELLAMILLVFGLRVRGRQKSRVTGLRDLTRGFVCMLVGALLMGMSTVCVAKQVTSVVTPPFLNVLDVGDGRWRVTGTVSAGDPSTRMAVIEETDSGAAVLIRPGSRIFDGVRVEDVQRDFVALLVDGRSVHLRVSTGSGRGGGAQPAAFPLIALERMSPSEFRVSYKDFRAMLVAISTSSSGNVVGRVRSSNNDSLLQIKAVQPSGVLDRLGLEAGDVVIALQGEAIGGLAQAESVLNAVRPGTTLLVVYRRAESVRQLSIEVRRQDGGG